MDYEEFFKSCVDKNKEIAMKGYTFEAIMGENQTVKQRKYIDISYVNYWIDGKGNPIYKVHMRNGEILDVDSSKFNKEYCPRGVNVINEVVKREYL